MHCTVFGVILCVLSVMRTVDASEFPERECCDPIYPSIPDAVPSESDVMPTDVDDTGMATVPSIPGVIVSGQPGK